MISIYIWNSIAVAFYGMILSASFCEIHWTTKKRMYMFSFMVFLMAAQGIIYANAGSDIVKAIVLIVLGIYIL